jgi:parallel beta-helix repeat protein
MTYRLHLASITAIALMIPSLGCGDSSGGSGTGGDDTGSTSSTTGATTSASTGDTSSSSSGQGGGGSDSCEGADTEGCDVLVAPGGNDAENLQEALIDGVDSGQTVCLCPGTFELDREISLTVPDVTIRGIGETRDDVVLDFAGQTVDDDGMAVDADGFTIEHLTVKNTPGNGILVSGADRVTFRDLLVTWDGGPSVENGAYAVYPVRCTQVLVENCEIVGAADAGIYVGQSSSIIVRDNLVHQNVAGIEIENSDDADVYDNEAYDNTAGILVFVLPNLEKKDGNRNKVHRNIIRDNNRENFAEDGTIVAAVPPGIGFFGVASDVTEVHDNTFENNITTSILLVSWPTIAEALPGAEVDPETDQYLTGTFIHDNTFEGNGTDPQGLLFTLPVPVADVVWDGVEEGKEGENSSELCLSADPPSFRDFNGASNIGIPDNHLEDTGPYECDGEELPAQEL